MSQTKYLMLTNMHTKEQMEDQPFWLNGVITTAKNNFKNYQNYKFGKKLK